MSAPNPCDLSIVIPCYNESEGLEELTRQLTPVVEQLRRNRTVELLFIDDGSTDETYPLLRRSFGHDPQVRIVQQGVNRGLGAALRTGTKESRGRIVLFTDSDCTYPPETIPELLELMSPDVQVVTSSYHPCGGVEGVPPYCLVFSRGASMLYRLLVDPRVYTWTAMYRAYRREVLERVQTRTAGYVVIAELLVEALLAGYRVAEYPTVLHVRRSGQSEAKVWKITREYLRFQAQILRRRIAALMPFRSKAVAR
ncbi:MAG: glycosyltransferase family 2 protein [Acidimicrobiia bacterium]|nr:glycosyltransferase family 2 protein [Acidimicrobiia bacterium]